MPQATQQPTEHNESFLERILDRHHEHENKGQAAENKPQADEGELHSDLKKHEEGFKQYLKEDKQLEEEGQAYGGLM
ncbi:hypothetical protein N7517_009288 [Penicillium concentricum]|uniref:Uncharacterized protein n=1 Tax=Penicillium concentricum TaxID=293559 RepID=A0A9W9RGY5_9EURO|nr:uncharacterized protein N7517_009288 [Penicillium concentricum]KAJ5360097.1 hypothetical protein N7517_009288 [Penicillium concentricum]